MDKRTRVRMDRTQQEILISFIAQHKANMWSKPTTHEDKVRQHNLLTQLGLLMKQHGLNRNSAEWQKMFVNWRSVVRTKLARKAKVGQTLSEFEQALVAVMPDSDNLAKQDVPSTVVPTESATKNRVTFHAVKSKKCTKPKGEKKEMEDKLKRLVESQKMRAGSVRALNCTIDRLASTIENLKQVLSAHPDTINARFKLELT